jgi:uncharacterized membrane protein YkoI
MRALIGIALGAGLGLVLLATAGWSAGQEQRISPDQVPQKVMDALKARFPGAEITSVEKENEGGKVVYDFEFKVKGHKYESDIDENGTMLEFEKEIPVKDLPAAVTRALKAKYPGATFKEAMEVNRVTGKDAKLDHYEVTIRANGKSKEVTVSLDGKKIEEEGAESDEKK